MKENDSDYVALVIKKPSCCWECRFEHFGLCMATYERYSIKYLNAIPALCPLKPMPKKKNEEIVIKGHTGEIAEACQDGWNACLEEITGETE